jgi:PAS domain S-box-containing protein
MKGKNAFVEKLVSEHFTRNRDLFAHAPLGIVITDSGGRIIRKNTTLEEISGISEVDSDIFAGGKIRYFNKQSKILSWDEMPAATALRTRRIIDNVEIGTSLNKGEIRWSAVTAVPLDSGYNYVVVMFRDITTGRSALEKLHESEERFRLLSESGGISVGFYSVEGKVLFLNRKAAEYFDGNPEDFTGKGLQEIIEDSSGNKYLGRIARASLTDRVFTFEDRVHYKNGNEWYSSIYSRVCNPAGEVIGVQILAKNITRQKNIELKLRQVTAELREHTNRLQDMIENERLQLSRDLHDVVGQRLAALNFYCSWLRTKIGDKVEGIDTAMNDIENILNDTIKCVVEMSYGLRPDILDELGLCSAVEWQIAEFRRNFNIECSFHFLPSGIDVDKKHSLAVFRIIQEALTNILRHSKATRASVGINMKNNNLRVVIRDNGIGIDPAILTSLKSLGLIGMKERARAFGGEVYFTNLKGGGTRILALFPLKHAGMN